MDKKLYHELLRLRKSEENYVFTLMKSGLFAREVETMMDIPSNRFWYIVDKISSEKNGIWYGVSVGSSHYESKYISNNNLVWSDKASVDNIKKRYEAKHKFVK